MAFVLFLNSPILFWMLDPMGSRCYTQALLGSKVPLNRAIPQQRTHKTFREPRLSTSVHCKQPPTGQAGYSPQGHPKGTLPQTHTIYVQDRQDIIVINLHATPLGMDGVYLHKELKSTSTRLDKNQTYRSTLSVPERRALSHLTTPTPEDVARAHKQGGIPGHFKQVMRSRVFVGPSCYDNSFREQLWALQEHTAARIQIRKSWGMELDADVQDFQENLLFTAWAIRAQHQ